jgi:hypothetical protein
MKDDKDEVPKSVRDWYGKIGKKGGAASKGTKAAKIRSQKAQEARLAKEAKLKALGPVPASPAWITAVQLYQREVVFNDQLEKFKFQLRVASAIEKNDMRKLGKYFDFVKQHVRE